MTSSPLRDGFPSVHRITRQQIESSVDLHQLFFAIDADPLLIGAGVVYIDPRLTPKLLKLKQATGSLPKRISATETQASTASHIRDAMAATLGLGSSAMSGNINTLAIGIYEEVMP
ncbi:hypothetical protein [Pseudomonas brenneri]